MVQPLQSINGLLSLYAITNQRVTDVPILLQNVSAHRVILQKKTMFLEHQLSYVKEGIRNLPRVM